MSGEVIERINLWDLKPADYNPRKINDKEKEKLKKSLTEFGLVEPLLVNLKNNTLVGGHQRLNILLDLCNNDDSYSPVANILKKGDIGWVFLDDDLIIKDSNHEKALNLALNRVGGEWDMEKLHPLLDELKPFKEVEFTGFDIVLEKVAYEPLPSINDSSKKKISNDNYTDFEEDNDEVIYHDTSNNQEETIIDDETDYTDYGEVEIINKEYEEDYKLKPLTEEVNVLDKPEVITLEEETVVNKTKSGEFIEYGDIYKLGNNVIMYGDYNNPEEKQELITSLNRFKHKVKYGGDVVKIATSKVTVDYYMTTDPEVMEDKIWDYEVSTDERAIKLNIVYEYEKEENDTIW